MWKRGCCLPAKASATMAVHARLLLGLHKRWLCISEELTEARMDMYTHMCASMCLRAFGLHKITYEYSSGASECWFAGSVTCTKVVLPMVLVCPICDDEKSSLHSCNSASRSISHKCRGRELYSVVNKMSWFQQAQEGARPAKQQFHTRDACQIVFKKLAGNQRAAICHLVYGHCPSRLCHRCCWK